LGRKSVRFIAMEINKHFNPAGLICYWCIYIIINYMSLPQQRLLIHRVSFGAELSELGFETSIIYAEGIPYILKVVKKKRRKKRKKEKFIKSSFLINCQKRRWHPWASLEEVPLGEPVP